MTTPQKQAIRALIQRPEWQSLLLLAKELREEWQNEDIKKDDQFNTLWAMAQKEAKCEALLSFFDTAEKMALEYDQE